MAKKVKYFRKEVSFAGEPVVLFSIDGSTWSTRKEELLEIQERHELEKASYGGQIKGGPQARIPTPRPKASSVQTRKTRGPISQQEGREEEAKGSAPSVAEKKEETKKSERKKAGKAAAKEKSKKSSAPAKKKESSKKSSKSSSKGKSTKKSKSLPSSKAKSKAKGKGKKKSAA